MCERLRKTRIPNCPAEKQSPGQYKGCKRHKAKKGFCGVASLPQEKFAKLRNLPLNGEGV